MFIYKDIQVPEVKRNMSITTIANAIYHFGIMDKWRYQCNAYLLTIHVNHMANIPKIAPVIYMKITGAISSANKDWSAWNGPNRPGMVYCGDTDGSRVHALTDTPLYPHVHAMVYVPLGGGNGNDPETTKLIIKNAIKNVREVESVHVEKYGERLLNYDIVDVNTYAIKAFFKESSHLHAFDCFEVRVFPYELDIKRKNGRKKKKIQKSAAQTEEFILERMKERFALRGQMIKKTGCYKYAPYSLRNEHLKPILLSQKAREEVADVVLDLAPNDQEVDVWLSQFLLLGKKDSVEPWLQILDEGLAYKEACKDTPVASPNISQSLPT